MLPLQLDEPTRVDPDELPREADDRSAFLAPVVVAKHTGAGALVEQTAEGWPRPAGLLRRAPLMPYLPVRLVYRSLSSHPELHPCSTWPPFRRAAISAG